MPPSIISTRCLSLLLTHHVPCLTNQSRDTAPFATATYVQLPIRHFLSFPPQLSTRERKRAGAIVVMGNAIAGKRRTARVMKVDGSTCKYKPPAVAGDALRDHPGHHLLEPEEVRRLGVRARPLDPDAPLKPGKLYFLVELPRLAAPSSSSRVPRRTWSGALTYGGGGAGERLESLMLARRSASDVAATVKAMAAAVEAGEDGAVRLRVRLPKAEVARLVGESRDAGEAAEKIMRLCVDRDHHQQLQSAPATPVLRTPAVMPAPAIASSRNKKNAAAAGAKKEKKARFVTVPDEIIGF
ncbi:hypothetical protein PR202_gb03134 [Eleusine coracana subsp. coracana]|uniref:Uncharacterized protein n=1 Tax=Eleusine coracana subsp. coracana TaxID=191504 RepID=A0AAV5E192_ELECO|nr:hypothetical protein QOZ80_8BG0660520 [Eleusine coracana subsp. coracana]GJN16174.1 hypothetical protein PR202_gb03134 [Eleusine coracana subsp. coracana]